MMNFSTNSKELTRDRFGA